LPEPSGPAKDSLISVEVKALALTTFDSVYQKKYLTVGNKKSFLQQNPL
jgi:hypothetical protein